MKNYYQILGLESNATHEEIKTAYKYLAKKFHPDKNLDDPKAEKYFKDIQEAYECLSDSNKRRNYDNDFYNWTVSKGSTEPEPENLEELQKAQQFIAVAQKNYFIFSLFLGVIAEAIILNFPNTVENFIFLAPPGVILGLYIYSLPTLFAFKNGHPHRKEIAIFNIFCFIPAIFPFGWIMLLIYSFNRFKGVNAVFLLLLGLFAQNMNKNNNNI